MHDLFFKSVHTLCTVRTRLPLPPGFFPCCLPFHIHSLPSAVSHYFSIIFFFKSVLFSGFSLFQEARCDVQNLSKAKTQCSYATKVFHNFNTNIEHILISSLLFSSMFMSLFYFWNFAGILWPCRGAT